MYSKPFLALLLLIAIFQSAGCGNDAVSPTEKFDWFFVNFTAYEHNIKLEVNGESLMSFDDGSGFDSKPSPLGNGDNQVRIICVPKNRTSRFGSEIRLLLSPTMIVGAAPLPGIEISQIENYTEIELTISMTEDTPERFLWQLKEWADADKTNLLYEMTVDKDAFFTRPSIETGKSYSEDGRPYRDWHYEGDKLISAVYYKPDGTIGSKVDDGNGTYTEWFDDGTLNTKIPVTDGDFVGPVKIYNEDGTLHSEITTDEWNNS